MGQHLEDRSHAVHRPELVHRAVVPSPRPPSGNVVRRGVARHNQLAGQLEAVAVVVHERVGARLDARGYRAVRGEHRSIW